MHSISTPVSQQHAGQHEAGQVATECLAIAADLERLKTLIGDAGDRLLTSFNRVGAVAPALDGASGAELQSAVGAAVTALQFQDMATQLIEHAHGRLVALERCLAHMAPELHDGLLAAHLQPVRQSQMSAGSIDLF